MVVLALVVIKMNNFQIRRAVYINVILLLVNNSEFAKLGFKFSHRRSSPICPLPNDIVDEQFGTKFKGQQQTEIEERERETETDRHKERERDRGKGG